MEIRNLMEDKVINLVNEICDEDEKSAVRRYCTSTQCRMDAACFVLNRIPQRYVTSGRGFAYLESDFLDNPQLQVDLFTLVTEGLQRVTTIQRSFYGQDDGNQPIDLRAEYYFFFPTIKGRIYNGMTFEPIINITVELVHDGKIMPMIDTRWSNPYGLVGNTAGTYLFWPHPVEAKEKDIERIFEFSLRIDDPEFEPFTHYISIPVRSESVRMPKASIRDYNVSDLFILPRGKASEMEYSLADDGSGA